MRLTFGKHKGMLLTDVPTDYLDWVCKKSMESGTSFNGIHLITDELKRRGQKKVNLTITPHARERAQSRLHFVYRQMKRPKESLNNWILRVFEWVIQRGEVRVTHQQRNGKKFKQPRYEYFLRDSVKGWEWRFVTQGNDAHQTLITVYPSKEDVKARKVAQK